MACVVATPKGEVMIHLRSSSALLIVGLLAIGCGPASSTGDSTQEKAPSPESEVGFDPAADPTFDPSSDPSDDASPNDDVSPSDPGASPSGDAGASDPVLDSATPPAPASEDAGVGADTAKPAVDSGTSAKDSGSAPAKDSGAKDSGGTPAKDSGTPVVDSGAAVDSSAPVDSGSPVVTPPPPSADCTALAQDLAARDALPQSPTSLSSWYSSSMQGGFGPAAASFPAVATPSGCDRITFMRERVLAAAKHYIGLPYQHHHVPGWNPSSAWSAAEGPGLDCSNFTAWVYNFGLGIKFTSNVVDQGDGASAPGRALSSSETLQLGDLLYITSADGSAIAHVVMFVDEGHIIDDTSGTTVAVRAFSGWYKTRFSHARRIIE